MAYVPRSDVPLACAAEDFKNDGPRDAPLSPKAFFASVLAGLAFSALPASGAVARFASVSVHEVGHAALYWSVSQPSVPAPNLFGQTGHALSFGFSWIAFCAWIILWVVFVVMFRSFAARVAAVLLCAAQAAVALAPSASDFAVVFAGHGAEAFAVLAFAAAAGWAREVSDGTKCLFAALSGAFAWSLASLAWNLFFDPSFAASYAAGRPDLGVANDLVRIAGAAGFLPLAAGFGTFALAAVPAGYFGARAVRRGWVDSE